jgi:CotH kinase protein
MKQIFTLIFLLCALLINAWGQSISLFDDSRVSKIYVELPADSLQQMIDNLGHEYYYHARFIFDDGVVRDTVENIGLRLRGNTSLGAHKKSFKISFNAYAPGREYQGVRKLNLRGSHNDPTMIREKLFYDVWEKIGMPARRAGFVQFYVNNVYRGLYTNLEELDKQWLTRAYGNNDGNFFKCTWPADLVYHGDDPVIYKSILNNPASRAYDLSTNETADDYTRLVDLIRTLDQPVDGNYANNLSAILNVESVLKSFALDVATGNWDDYFVNKNNYYLYDNPTTNRFEFITLDWVGSDWAKRNCLQWHSTFEPLPLATKLLEVPAFYNRYVFLLDSFTRYILHPDTIFPRIDYYHQLITPAAVADTYRSLDWGYDVAAFHNGFTQAIDGHTPYGIKPFLEMRYDSTLRQIAHLISGTTAPAPQALAFTVFPNPVRDRLLLQPEPALSGEIIYGILHDMYGRIMQTWEWQATATPYALLLQDIPAGMYCVQLHNEGQKGFWLVLRR